MPIKETGTAGKFKGFDYEDGQLVKTAYFSGYPFGDRLLEGVMFKATINDDGSMSVEVAESSRDYMLKLNERKWVKEALDFAMSGDLFMEKEDGGETLCLIGL